MYLHSDTVSMISSNENLIMGLLCLLAVDIPNDLKQAVVIYASPPPLHPFTPPRIGSWVLLRENATSDNGSHQAMISLSLADKTTASISGSGLVNTMSDFHVLPRLQK